FYTQGGDYIVVNQNQLLLDRHTTEHEVGHFFTLAHTHRGWEDQPYDPAIHGDTVLVTTVNSSQSPTIGVELVDGSNCGNLGWNNPLAGDGICDTPPDYGFGQRCNCCNMGWTVYDRNGDLIEPMLNNVMSYSENCSPWNFTPQQVLAVKTSYDSDRRAYLRVNEVSDYTPLTEGSIIVSPMNLETIDSYNGVLLEWEPVPNAEEYIITIDGTVANEYRTSNTELYLTDLKPNGNYLWSVIPINKFGAGCQPNDSKLFFTGNSTTSVNDLTAINDLRIYPNPVERGSDLQISFNSDNAFEAKIRLIALDGKAINETNNIRVNNGSNTISFPVNNASSGLHFIEISNSEGIKIQKIIIE
ncbi:MAG: T9SS type A sorting domain-containing protein, partial [Bacteroidia bacterium]|nr:T9SS type A sorting domain-containing protein [Bacteroidia bacterium]